MGRFVRYCFGFSKSWITPLACSSPDAPMTSNGRLSPMSWSISPPAAAPAKGIRGVTTSPVRLKGGRGSGETRAFVLSIRAVGILAVPQCVPQRALLLLVVLSGSEIYAEAAVGDVSGGWALPLLHLPATGPKACGTGRGDWT